MTNSRNERAPTQAREILDYFLRSPQAAPMQRSVDDAGNAPHWLVAEGFLIEESSPGAGPVFRLNDRRVSQAKQFLDSVNDVHRWERESGEKP